ncbi:MAG: NAD(P)-dependent oxidoreductase, partial [Gallionellaceae bacterium]
DFFKLVSLILAQPPINEVFDCYTQAPVDKMTLLANMKERFGLRYEVSQAPVGVNATGVKMKYFSNNPRAEVFGYLPSQNSLQTVLREASLVLAAAGHA